MKQFAASRVKRTKTIAITRPVEEVFPMFQPEGEKSWVTSWNPQFVFPADGKPVQGLVFTHETPAGGKSIWTMTGFDPVEHRIEYTVVYPGSHVNQIHINCEANGSCHTNATVSYTVTPLCDSGLEVLEGYAPEEYEHRILTWQKAIEHYFATGEAMDLH